MANIRGMSSELQKELNRMNPSLRETWRSPAEVAASKRFLPKARVKPSTPDPVRQRIEHRDLQVGDGGTPVDTLGIQRKAYAFYAFGYGRGFIIEESNWHIGAKMYGFTRPIELELFYAACKTIELDMLDHRSRTDFKFRHFDYHMKVYETDPYRGQVSKSKQPIRFNILGKEATKAPARGKGKVQPDKPRKIGSAALQKAAAATLSVLRDASRAPAGQQYGLAEQRGKPV